MIPRNWRLQQQRYRLAAKVCEGCQKMIFPPRNVCPACEARANAARFSAGFSIPVEIVRRETQNGDVAKVLAYDYKSHMVTVSRS
ncbi:MAG: hypothetical protein GY847_32115 [Proteobacteria bacterium]|nr:hypothetical protein [Pseudomonadota bacterium]